MNEAALRTRSLSPLARVRRVLLVALLSAAAPALAANIGFMDDSPFAYFSEQDRELFKGALVDILDKGTDGESRLVEPGFDRRRHDEHRQVLRT